MMGKNSPVLFLRPWSARSLSADAKDRYEKQELSLLLLGVHKKSLRNL